MKSATSILSALLGTAMTFALVSAAQATATRTYVSNAGDDTNTATNCPHSAPCKTFSAAYSVTQSGGEIIALDLGAYGPLTITTPLSISALAGAIITVQTGTVGITVTAGATNVVILRNFQISGAAGSSNTKGIQVNSGRLVPQYSTLKFLTTALVVNNSKADVNDNDIIGNATGISTTGTGGDAQNFPATGATTEVRISGGRILDNTTAFVMNDPGLRPSPATDNRITIFLLNQGGGITPVMAGNTTVISGTGSSCTSQCLQAAQYSSQVGSNQN